MVLLLLNLFLAKKAYAEDLMCKPGPAVACTPSGDSPAQLACALEWKSSGCDELLKIHPELKNSCKIKDCSVASSSSQPASAWENLKLCDAKWEEAWKDMAVGTFKFLTGEATAISQEEINKLDYFKNCTTVECKRQMLGSFSSYFTKEEIEGHPERTDLDPTDPANQNYLQGYSAAGLYRKLLIKLKKDLQDRNMDEKFLDEKFIEPWSGKEAKLPSSFNELIDGVLLKAGIKNTACFRPEVVIEMRCYAFFSVVDPLMMAGAGAKILKIAGLTNKEAVLAGKIADSTTAPRKLADNPQINIWKMREAGRADTADFIEKNLIKEIKNSEIVRDTPVGTGETHARFVTLSNGSKGIWKSNENILADSLAEKAAARVDRQLGLNRVPITVEKELKGQKGTFQYLIDDTDGFDEKVNGRVGQIAEPDQFAFYDYLIENGDRHSQNYLTREGRPIAIDHGISFRSLAGAGKAPDFPGKVDEIIAKQKSTENSLQFQKDRLNSAKQAGAKPREIKKMEAEIAKAEKQVSLDRIKATQNITALGITKEAKDKLATTTDGRWDDVLVGLQNTQKDRFLYRRTKALEAIKKAEDYFGEGIFPQGLSSPLVRKPKRKAKSWKIEHYEPTAQPWGDAH